MRAPLSGGLRPPPSFLSSLHCWESFFFLLRRGRVGPAASDVRYVSGSESDCAAQLGVWVFLLALGFHSSNTPVGPEVRACFTLCHGKYLWFEKKSGIGLDRGRHFLDQKKVAKEGAGARLSFK